MKIKNTIEKREKYSGSMPNFMGHNTASVKLKQELVAVDTDLVSHTHTYMYRYT